MLKLEAKTKNEQIILDYLNANVSETLADKINNGVKTLSQCWNYIFSEAKKLAENNCACVDNDTVFGWAVHFFEEDGITAEKYNKTIAGGTVTTSSNKTEKTGAKVIKKISRPTEDTAQISIFDML